jgi:hypothetical protein
MQSSGFICAQCQTPVSRRRLQLLQVNPGEWFSCATPWCDWVHLYTFDGRLEFSSQADARTHAIPLRGEPRALIEEGQ